MSRDYQRGSALIVIIILGIFLIIGGLGYVMWNNFFRTTNETSTQTATEQTPEPDAIPNVTITLPNGKTATYPDIKTYKNIQFLPQSDSSSPETVIITHAAYKEYMDYLGGNADELCGTDDNLKALKKDIIYGLLNTLSKAITYPQNQNCVEFIASDENSDPKFKAGAQQVLDRVKSDIGSFLKVVSIQK